MSRKPSRSFIAARRSPARLAALAAALFVAGFANAQTLSNTFEGVSESSNEPIDIESDSLVLHNKGRYATFEGDVKAVQGDTILQAQKLNVHIAVDEDDAAPADASEAKEAEDPNAKEEKEEEGEDDQADKMIGVSDDPMDVEADVLVVHDKDKYATFRGNVKAVQGTSTLSAGELTVNYVGGDKLASASQATKALYAEGAAGGSNTQISKIEAKGNVVITSKKDNGNNVLQGHRLVIDVAKEEAWIESAGSEDAAQGASRVRASFMSGAATGTDTAAVTPGEAGPKDITAANAGSGESGGAAENEVRAKDGGAKQDKGHVTKIEATGNVVINSGEEQTTTSDWALYDVPSQLITVGGNVVLTQGQNVLKGNRLLIDLTTGESRFENTGTAAARGRIQGLFVPGDGDKSKEAQPADAKPAAPDGEAAASGETPDAGGAPLTAGEPEGLPDFIMPRR